MKIDGTALRVIRFYGKQNGKCPYTGLPLLPFMEIGEVSEDHIIPLSKKGPNGIENIYLVPAWVNQLKKDLSVEEFGVLLKDKGLPCVI